MYESVVSNQKCIDYIERWLSVHVYLDTTYVVFQSLANQNLNWTEIHQLFRYNLYIWLGSQEVVRPWLFS